MKFLFSIYTQRKILSNSMFFWNDKWYDTYHKITDQIISRTQWWPVRTCGGYTRYWTLNNRCHQVIHKWRFESEMTILSCFLNCEGQYLKWTCFTIYIQRKKLSTTMCFWNDKWYYKYHENTDQTISRTQCVTVLELDLWAVNFLFFPRRDLNSHHWYTAAPFA
jgi:hypothetical protein